MFTNENFDEIVNFIKCPNIFIDKYINKSDYLYILKLLDNDLEFRDDGCYDCNINDLLSISKHITILIIIQFYSFYNYTFLNKYILIIDKHILGYSNIKLVDEYLTKNQNIIICEYKEISIYDFLLNYGTIKEIRLNKIYKNNLKKLKNKKVFNDNIFYVAIFKQNKNVNYNYNICKSNKIINSRRHKSLISEIYKRIIIMNNRIH